MRVPLRGAYPDQEDIGLFDTAADWTAVDADTVNVASEPHHITGSAAIEFDKVNGVPGTVFAHVYRTFAPALDLSRFGPDDEIQAYLNVPNIANVAYAFIRLGTDVSNYTEWRLADASIAAGTWQAFHIALAGSTAAGLTGNGYDLSAIAYAEVGVAFDAAANALADILWDCLRIVSSQHTRT